MHINQVLNMMSYKALPNVRVKINDMSLMETRNLLVAWCLLDATEDIFTRATAILDIHRSVDILLASAESKVLKQSLILACIFLLFVEVSNELEFLASGHYEGPDLTQRCQIAVNLQGALVQIIISCTGSSLECRKVTHF